MVSGSEIRERSEAKNQYYNKGCLVCDNCGGKYKIKKSEFPDDFDECACGGELKYHEYDIYEDNAVNIKSMDKFSRLILFSFILIIFVGSSLILISYLLVHGHVCPYCGSTEVDLIPRSAVEGQVLESDVASIYHCQGCDAYYSAGPGGIKQLPKDGS